MNKNINKSFKAPDQYFKIAAHHEKYKGTRFFRFNFDDENAIQACLVTGEVKKGKSNTFGVYLISKMTLFANYMAPGYIVPCSKREYQKAFDKIVQMLK